MAGKTCFMRTIGVNLLAAKTLHTCFAEVFEINTEFLFCPPFTREIT